MCPRSQIQAVGYLILGVSDKGGVLGLSREYSAATLKDGSEVFAIDRQRLWSNAGNRAGRYAR